MSKPVLCDRVTILQSLLQVNEYNRALLLSVLLDSNGKKIRFLKQFIADLKLTNVIAVQTRVENEDSIHDLGQFDVITSRAFASLTDFINASKPYMHPDSIIASMKGLVPHDEVEAFKNEFSCDIIALKVPRLDEQRHLLLLKRI
jgi:16S rRNA (guanine527-N7)-methyltransferase